MQDPAVLRQNMVATQLAERGIADERVLGALRAVPRHYFVPREYAAHAYDDRPLPIGWGQTISQPFMVGYMTELLALQPGDRVLEIGTGSGYQTAVLASLAAQVVTIEREPDLSARARTCLERLGYRNIHFACGDGSLGYTAGAPYDAILVTAGSPDIPAALLAQLGDHGRLVCPVGGRKQQQLKRMVREGDGWGTSIHTDCVFVPLLGEAGWPDEATEE